MLGRCRRLPFVEGMVGCSGLDALPAPGLDVVVLRLADLGIVRRAREVAGTRLAGDRDARSVPLAALLVHKVVLGVGEPDAAADLVPVLWQGGVGLAHLLVANFLDRHVLGVKLLADVPNLPGAEVVNLGERVRAGVFGASQPLFQDFMVLGHLVDGLARFAPRGNVVARHCRGILEVHVEVVQIVGHRVDLGQREDSGVLAGGRAALALVLGAACSHDDLVYLDENSFFSAFK